MDMQYRDLDARLMGVGMQRGALFTLLREAWPQHAQLHVDTQITAIDHAGVRVQDHRGHRHGPYDLIIAADGSASTLRAQAQGTQLDRVYPWGALWCLLPREDWPFVDELRQRYIGARKMIGLLPVGTRPGDDSPRLSFSGACRAAILSRGNSVALPPGAMKWRRCGPKRTRVWPRCRCMAHWHARVIAMRWCRAGIAAASCLPAMPRMR